MTQARTSKGTRDAEAAGLTLGLVALALCVPVGLMLVQGSRSAHAVTLVHVACATAFGAVLSCVFASYRAARTPRAVKVGPYTLGDKIGEGGMGVVYRATHASSPRPTAIKLLPKERASARNRARFELEVRRTSLLTHPNTISVFDSGQTSEGGCYYAMEYVDGLDLQALVDEEGPLAPKRVARVLVQVLGALAEAHRNGLVHRDVKPANIMLCTKDGGDDVIKVLDFGLVQDLGTDAGSSDPNELVGTPLYLSPEAVTEPERLDARSDLYAVGAVGYFLLTGSPPFSGRNVLEVCAQHLYEVPVPPSHRVDWEIPRELETLILQCLEKSPDRRPSSAELLRAALERIVDNRPECGGFEPMYDSRALACDPRTGLHTCPL